MIAPGPAGLQPVGAAAAGPPPKKLSENRPNLLFFSALRGVECRSRIVSKPRLSWPLRPATPATPWRGPGPAPPPTPPFRGAPRGRLGTAPGTSGASPACGRPFGGRPRAPRGTPAVGPGLGDTAQCVPPRGGEHSPGQRTPG